MLLNHPINLLINHCRNCTRHQCGQVQQFYQHIFKQISKAISKSFPNIIIQHNQPSSHLIPINTSQNQYFNTITNKYFYFPQIGSFEIILNGQNIFSLKHHQKYPNPQQMINSLKVAINNIILANSNSQSQKKEHLFHNINPLFNRSAQIPNQYHQSHNKQIITYPHTNQHNSNVYPQQYPNHQSNTISRYNKANKQTGNHWDIKKRGSKQSQFYVGTHPISKIRESKAETYKGSQSYTINLTKNKKYGKIQQYIHASLNQKYARLKQIYGSYKSFNKYKTQHPQINTIKQPQIDTIKQPQINTIKPLSNNNTLLNSTININRQRSKQSYTIQQCVNAQIYKKNSPYQRYINTQKNKQKQQKITNEKQDTLITTKIVAKNQTENNIQSMVKTKNKFYIQNVYNQQNSKVNQQNKIKGQHNYDECQTKSIQKINKINLENSLIKINIKKSRINDSPIHHSKIWKSSQKQSRNSKQSRSLCSQRSKISNQHNNSLFQQKKKGKISLFHQQTKTRNRKYQNSSEEQRIFCMSTQSLEDIQNKKIIRNQDKKISKSFHCNKDRYLLQDGNEDIYITQKNTTKSQQKRIIEKQQFQNNLKANCQQSDQKRQLNNQQTNSRYKIKIIKNQIGIQKSQHQSIIQIKDNNILEKQTIKSIKIESQTQIKITSNKNENDQINLNGLLIERALILQNIYGYQIQKQKQKYLNYIRQQSNVDDDIDIFSKIQNIKVKRLSEIYPKNKLFNKECINGCQIDFNRVNLENFRKVVKILCHKNQFLIIRLFQNISKKNLRFYGVWIFYNNEWRCIVTNDMIYVDESGLPYYSCPKSQSLMVYQKCWIHILEKVLAKVLGNYEQLMATSVENLLQMLTGANYFFFKIKQQFSQNTKFLRFLSEVQNKNCIIYGEKNHINIEQYQQSSKNVMIYYMMSQTIVNNNQILVKCRVDKKQPFWINISKLCQLFKTVSILQLRMNHNFTLLKIKTTPCCFTVLQINFQEKSFGNITIATEGQPTQLRAYLYKQQNNNALRMIGNVKEKKKNQLFFDCSFKEGRYIIFVYTDKQSLKISYLGEGFPQLKMKQQISQNGLKNEYTEYISIDKIPINSIQSKIPKFLYIKGGKYQFSNSKMEFSQFNKSSSLSRLKESFIEYLIDTNE